VAPGGRTTISYDPNVRMAKLGPVEAGRAAVERVVALAHLVKVSAEDLAWLYPGEEPVVVATRWSAAGPELVVVTLGADGAVGLGPDRRAVHRDAPPIDLVDTLGAGDAFSAGLLGALAERGALGRGAAGLAGVDLPAVLDRACLVAALTCARPGADPPTLAEVAEAENPPPTPLT
jgi:fructokinase